MALEEDRIGDYTVSGSDDGGIGDAVRQPQTRSEMQTIPGDATVGGSRANTADHHRVVLSIIEFDAGAGAARELEIIRAEAITRSQFMRHLPAVAKVSAKAFFPNGKLVRLIRGNTNLLKQVDPAGFLRQAQQERGKGVELIAGRPAQQLRGALGKMEPAGVGHVTVAGDLILHLVGILEVGLETAPQVVGALLPVDARVVVPFRLA